VCGQSARFAGGGRLKIASASKGFVGYIEKEVSIFTIRDYAKSAASVGPVWTIQYPKEFAIAQFGKPLEIKIAR
jgi:hypothetical protein